MEKPIAAFLLLLTPLASSAQISVTCTQGCRPVTACQGNATAFLLCLNDRASNVQLSWQIATQLDEQQTLHVYAGNPARAGNIPERAVSFEQNGGTRTGTFTFTPDDLGSGPLLVVTTVKRKNEESLLSWIPFRTSTEDETRSRLRGPEPGNAWSVGVTPALVQVSAGWRELPRTRDDRSRTWMSLASDQLLATDADLDGAASGVPGLAMQASSPWHAREDWKDKLQGLLGMPDGHDVKVGELQWEEKPDRVVDGIPGVGPIVLRNYYTVVTLFTNATVTTYTGRDIGRSGNDRFFAHETSASLKQLDHPLLWASYSRNDHGLDPRLLGLLNRHVNSNQPTLEVGPAHRINGDGGTPTYRAAFTVNVQPWSDESTSGMASPQAGVVAIDVLAVRTGFGGIRVPQNAGGGVQESLCALWKCNEQAGGMQSIDFNKPPKGYEVTPPQSSTLNVSGQVPILDGVQNIAERGVDARNGGRSTLPKFPSTAQFALAANLRSGALVRRGGFLGRRVDGIVPINSYAQYVVRIVVATFPGQTLETTEVAIVADPGEIAIATVQPPRRTLGQRIKEWIRDNLALSGTVLLVLVIALALLVPGFRSFLSAVFGLAAAIVRRITDLIKPKSATG